MRPDTGLIIAEKKSFTSCFLSLKCLLTMAMILLTAAADLLH